MRKTGATYENKLRLFRDVFIDSIFSFHPFFWNECTSIFPCIFIRLFFGISSPESKMNAEFAHLMAVQKPYDSMWKSEITKVVEEE